MRQAAATLNSTIASTARTLEEQLLLILLKNIDLGGQDGGCKGGGPKGAAVGDGLPVRAEWHICHDVAIAGRHLTSWAHPPCKHSPVWFCGGNLLPARGMPSAISTPAAGGWAGQKVGNVSASTRVWNPPMRLFPALLCPPGSPAYCILRISTSALTALRAAVPAGSTGMDTGEVSHGRRSVDTPAAASACFTLAPFIVSYDCTTGILSTQMHRRQPGPGSGGERTAQKHTAHRPGQFGK